MRTYAFACLVLLACFGSSCKKCDDPTDPACPNYCVDETDPECPNYDPCTAEMPVSAAFDIAEEIGRFAADSIIYVATDTVLANNYVRFKAFQAGAEYEWHIGTDPRTFDTQSVRLLFRHPTQLYVTLILRREPNLICFPGDDGIDTLRKQLVVVPIQQTALLGRYEGAIDQAPTEPYVLEFFERMRFEDSTTFDRISVTGLHPGCNNRFRYDAMTGESGYRAFAFNTYGATYPVSMCVATSGFAKLNAANDSLVFRFRRYDVETMEPLPTLFIFRGKRAE